MRYAVTETDWTSLEQHPKKKHAFLAAVRLAFEKRRPVEVFDVRANFGHPDLWRVSPDGTVVLVSSRLLH